MFHGYFKETRRPIYAAALVVPFLVVYHIGTAVFHTTYINGADALIIRLFSIASVNSMFASAVVLAVCFAVWQIRTHASWKVDSRKVAAMFLESACFALVLFYAFGWLTVRFSFAAGVPEQQGRLQRLVLYCGAGVYEELLFRAFLLGGLILLLTRWAGLKKGRAAVIAVTAASLLFAAFHYVGPAGDPFSFGSFFQRTLGGLYFSGLFVARGFGVTAAAHALYDILVGLVLA